MNDKKKKLYDNLIADGYKLGTYAQFEAAMGDASSRSKLYNNLTADGYNLGGLSDFESVVASPSAPSAPSAQPTATPSNGKGVQDLVGAIGKSFGATVSKANERAGFGDRLRAGASGAVELVAPSVPVLGVLAKGASDVARFGRNLINGDDIVRSPEERAAIAERQRELDEREKALDEAHANDTADKSFWAEIAEGLASSNYYEQIGASKRMQAKALGGTPYHTAKRKIEEERELLDEASRDVTGVGGRVKAIGRGLGTVADLDKWTSLQTLQDASQVAIARAKQARGDELSPVERELLETEADFNENAGSEEEMLSQGFRAGRVTAESVPFMFDFIMGGGAMGTIKHGVERAVVKGGVGALGRDLSTAGAKKALVDGVGYKALHYFGTTAGDVAAATALTSTLGGGRVMADAVEKATGTVIFDRDNSGNVWLDDTGRPRLTTKRKVVREDGMIGDEETSLSPGQALYEAFAENFIENYSELLGTHMKLSSRLGALAKKVAPGAAGAVSRLASTSAGKKLSGLLSKGGVNGLPEEILEEEAGMALGDANNYAMRALGYTPSTGPQIPIDAWTTPEEERSEEQQRSIDNFWQQQKDIVTGIGLSMGMMGAMYLGAHGAGYYMAKRGMDKADKVAAFQLTDDRWAPLRARIDGMESDKEREAFVEELRGSDYRPEEVNAILDYMGKRAMYNGYNLGSLMAPSSKEEADDSAAMAAGHEATPEERTQIQTRYDVSEQKFRNAFGIGAGVDVDEWLARRYPDTDGTSSGYAQAMGLRDPNLDDETRETMTEFFNARSAMQGVEMRMSEEIDDKIQENNLWVEQNTWAENGNTLVSATTTDGKSVYVVNGDLQFDGDYEDADMTGEYAIAQNGSPLIVRDADTGEMRQISDQDLEGTVTRTDAEQFRAQREQEIRTAMEQEQQRQLSGEPAFAPGDTYYFVDERGYGHTAVISMEAPREENGEIIAPQTVVSINGMPAIPLTDDIKQLITNDLRRTRVQQMAEEDAAEAENAAAEEEAPVTDEPAAVNGSEAPASPAVETREDVMATEPGDYELDDEVEAMSDSRKKVKGRVTGIDELSGEVEVEWENGNTVGGNAVGHYTPEQLRDLYAETKPTRAEVEAAAPAAETPAEEPGPAVTEAAVGEAPVVEAAAEEEDEEASEMPTKDDGTPDYVTAGVARTVAEIDNDEDLDDDERQAFIKSNINGITADVEKHDKKKPKMGRDMADYKRKKAEWQQKRDAMEAELDFWNAVDRKRTDNRREQDVYDTENRSARDIVAQLGEPRDLEEAVVMAMPGYKYIWGNSSTSATKGVGAHIGANSESERRNRVAWSGRQDKGALYPEQVAEKIYESLPDTANTSYDDVFNIVLETLRNYHSPRAAVEALAKNRADVAERNRDAETEHYAALHEEEARNAGFENVDEYDAWRSGVDAEGMDAVLAGRAADDTDTLFEAEESGFDANANDSIRGALASEETDAMREAEESGFNAEAEDAVRGAIAAAESETATAPTDAQKAAGNYKKGHVKLDGYNLSIEIPKGSTRSGKDADGKPWSVTMNNTYGYIRGTEGVDGDHIDVFLSDNPTSGNVYVVDQVNADGTFDEHKVMYGFNSADEAREAYLANYSEGWQGLGNITEVSKDEFKKWVNSSHRKTKPFAEYKSVKPMGAQNDALNDQFEAKAEEHRKKAAEARKEYRDLVDNIMGRPSQTSNMEENRKKLKKLESSILRNENLQLDNRKNVIDANLPDGVEVSENGYSVDGVKDAVRYVRHTFNGSTPKGVSAWLEVGDGSKMEMHFADDVEGLKKAADYVRSHRSEAQNEGGFDLNGETYTEEDIENMVADYVNAAIVENDLDAQIVGVKVIGSRTRGEEREDSDLDVLVEYEGGAHEDGMFNAINDYLAENGLDTINGVPLDINPITRGKSGTIEQFMKRNERFTKDEGSAEGNGLSAEEADAILASMKAHAEIQPELEFSEENWDSVFGENDIISTPIGEVKMGENQKTKLQVKERTSQFGMVVETLRNPDIVLEEADKEGDNLFHERPSSYLFVKTFKKADGTKYVHFESVTISKDGMEISISSHIMRENQLKNKLKSDRLLYKATALDAPANTSAEQSIEGGSLSSERKGTEESGNKQEISEKSADGAAKKPTRAEKAKAAQKAAQDSQLDLFATADAIAEAIKPEEPAKPAAKWELRHDSNTGEITMQRYTENPNGTRTYNARGKQTFKNAEEALAVLRNPANNMQPVLDEYEKMLTNIAEHDAAQAKRAEEAAKPLTPEKDESPLDFADRLDAANREKAEAAKPKPTRLVSDERMEELKKKLRNKLRGQLNVGVDPEVLAIGTELAVGHIERGLTKFADYAKAMIEDIGDVIRPYLKSFYNAVRDMPEAADYADAMDSYDEVRKADVNAIGTTENAPETEKTEKKSQKTEEKVVNSQPKEEPSLFDSDNVDETVTEQKPQFKVGDKVMYKGEEATIHSIETLGGETEYTLDTGMAPVMYEVAHDGEITLTPNNNEQVQGLQQRAPERGRNRQSANPNGTLGESQQPQTEGSQRGRVDAGNAVHSASDGQRAARPHGVRAQQRLLLEGQNQRNNRAERGTDYAPKSPAARYRANIAAIKLSQKLQESGAVATPEQMEVLRKYSGWGGLGTYLNNEESAKELRDLIGNDAFDQAAMSANSAYFTPAYVVDTLWDVAEKLGFKGGNILEGSAGIGNILGLMPQGVSDHSAIHAVEIDGISGTILSQLYPDAQVDIKGFEETKIPNGSVDLAITNVPFVTGLMVRDTTGDKDLSKRFRNIHDFCIAKNVRKLREGGLGIFITTSGTLDKSTDLRSWITKEGNADVVGAFRLNNETFGGTNATSDIIIVRKRVNGVKSPNAIDVSSVSAVRSTEYATGEYTVKAGKRVEEVQNLTMTYNGYFAQHPENMGGTMDFNFEHGDTFRPTGTGLYAQRGAKQSDALAAWVNSFDGFSAETESTKATSPADEVAKLNERLGSGVKEGSLVVNSKGEICVAHLGEAVPIKQSDKKVKGHTRQECLESYNAVKSALADVLDYQSTNADDEGLKPLLKKLNQEYDKFVATYGPFTKNVSIAFLKNDVDYASMTALEHYEEKGDKKGKRKVTISKRDVFNKRVVKVPVEPQPKNIADAITASIFTQGGIDLPYIAEKLNITEEDAKKQALEDGHVFENPATGGLEVDYEYLSGNVREKLNVARDNEAAYPGRYAANVSALEAVVPMTIPAHLIEYNIGSSWVDKRLFEEYVKARTGVTVNAVSANGTWELRQTSHGTPHNNRDFGVYSDMFKKHILGTTLIEAAMANRSISVSETHRDRYTGTTETITDKDATQACMNKIGEIRQDFKEWAKEYLQQNEEFAQKIEEEYNNRFNNYVPKSIPESYQREHLDGAWDGITLYPHQSSAVTRALTEPVLLAHEVGTGKTFTQISIAMEMRRLGTARKPMIVVQNATVGQFVASAKLLYPGAKVLTIEDNDKTAEGRKNFYAKIKYNDWDMIVVPQSVFERIPDSPERQAQFIQSKIDEKLATLEALKNEQENNNGSSMIVRSAERELEELEMQLSEIAAAASDKKKKKDAKREEKTKQNAAVRAAEMLDREVDDVEDFDDMGIDAILVDEAHEYKHLGFATAMQRGVKGVDPSYSKKAQSVYLKTQAVLEKSGGKNVVFATGTPISNTAAEIWAFMKYLMPERTMKDYGIYYFDDFVRNFGSIQQMLEFKTSGKFGEVNRFSAYVNLPELNRIWSSVADTVLTADAGKVSDKIPAIDGGKAEDIYLPQSRSLRAIMASVRAELERFEQMSGKDKKANSHIPLVCFGIAAKAAIDPRLASDNAPDEPQSKTNRAVEEVYADLQKTKSYKGTCAIFCDSYRNKNTGFNVYQEIADKLIAKGVPADQIFIMTSGMSVKKKAEVFDKVNRGEIRVILGSTQTLGTGVNIQERLHLLIHMDVPNRPMDYTQRNGRILRQGNLHKEWDLPVRILRFGVEDSLDVTGYQRLKTKGAIADSIMNGRKTLVNNQENRTIEEAEDQFGDTIAQLSGSEYAMLKNKAERDVRKYESKKKAHEADQVYVANTIRRNTAAIAQTEKALAEEKRLLGLIEEEYSGKEPTIKVGSNTFASMNDMEEFFKEFNKKQREREDKLRESGGIGTETTSKSSVDVNIGKYTFKFNTTLELYNEFTDRGTAFRIRRSMRYSCPELGLTDVPVDNGYLKNGVQDILENVVTGADLRSDIRVDEASVKRMNEELEALRAREGKPFPFDKELEEAENLLEEYTEKMREELEAKEAKYAEMDKEAGVADVGIGETSTDDLEDDDVLYRDDEEDDMSVRAQMERAMAGLKAHGPVFVVSSLEDLDTNYGWMKARRKSEYDELVDYFNDPNGPAALYLHEVGDIIVFNRTDGEIVGLHSSVVHEQVHSAMEKGVISIQELVDFYTSGNPLVMAVDKDIQSRGYKGLAVPEETLAHVVEFLTFDFATNSGKGIEVCEALENDPKVSTVIQKIQDFIYEDETRADKFWQRAVNARRRGAGSESLSSREDGNASEGSRIESQNRESLPGGEKPLFRLADEAEARELEKEPTVRVYRAMQLVENEDGTKMLVPPMAGKIEGKWQTGIKLDADGNILPGQWEVSDERPDLAKFKIAGKTGKTDLVPQDDPNITVDEKGQYWYKDKKLSMDKETDKPALYFWLDKGNKKGVPARYNPYWHTSYTPLNDQFSEAQSRSNLVTVEVEVPISELASGYKATGAKDSVGKIEWKAGIIQGQISGTRTVVLSRYDKPARIVSDAEVAKTIVGMFGDAKVTMPSNVVTPSLRAELEKLGVPFVETNNRGMLTSGEHKGKSYSSVYAIDAAKLREAEQAFLDARDSGKWKRGKGHPTIDHLARHLKMWTDAFGERVKFEVHRDGSAFTGRKAKAKGWFDPKTGKVHLILDNHHSDTDLQRTIFHEVAAHLGLRKMLGKDFYTFLNNIYENAEQRIKDEIDRLAREKYNGNRATATEEYMAKIAERMAGDVFPDQVSNRLWYKMLEFAKKKLMELLRKIGIKLNFELTDEDIAYVLWESYKNIMSSKASSNIFETAADIDMQQRLGVRNFENADELEKRLRRLRRRTRLMDHSVAEDDWMNEGQKRALETASLANDSQDHPTVVSSADGAKVLQNLRSAKYKYENISGYGKNFLGDVAKALNAHRDGSKSEYATFETVNGRIVTIRLADHNATASQFDHREEHEGISIVITPSPNEGLKDDGLAHIVEFYYNAVKLRRADGKPLVDIISSIEQALYSGEYKDRTGLAEREEINNYEDALYRDGEETAYDYYERAVTNKSVPWAKRFWYRFTENYQDQMKSLRKLQEAVVKESGKPLQDFENAYITENARTSQEGAAMELYKRNFYEPMMNEFYALVKKGAKRKEIATYLIAKHGLERNKLMLQREIDSKAEEYKKKLESKYSKEMLDTDEVQHEIKDSVKAYREQLAEKYNEAPKDFSGLTSLFEDETAFTENAADYVADFESKYDTAPFWDKIRAATREQIDMSYRGGIIDKQTRDMIKGMYEYYIPLRDFDEKTAEDVYEYVQRVNHDYSTPLPPKTKGRKSLADMKILATIGNMASSGIKQAHKNMMKQRLYNLALNHKTNLLTVASQWYKWDEVDKEWKPELPKINDENTAKEQKAIIDAFEAEMKTLEKQGKATRTPPRVNVGVRAFTQQQKEHTVNLRVNGKEKIVFVNGNPLAAQAVNGALNPDATEEGLYKLLRAVKNFKARNFTSRSLNFIHMNMLKDVLFSTEAVFVKENHRYFRQYSKNIASNFALVKMPRLVYKWNHGTLDMNDPLEKYFYEFITRGGETGFSRVLNKDYFEREIQRHLRKSRWPGILTIPETAWHSVWESIEFVNRAAEDLSRFTCYMTSRQMGRGIERSINDAKEITVNFNKKGRGDMGAKWLNSLFVFSNASIQGTANILDMHQKHPVKMGLVDCINVALGFILPSLCVWALGALVGGDDDDDWYWDLPKWMRRSNFVWATPKGLATYPIPNDLRPMYALGEMLFEASQGRMDWTDIPYEMVKEISALLPIDATGHGEKWGLNFAPSAVVDLAEIRENTDFFGKPIYRKYEGIGSNEADPEWTKAFKSTNKHLVALTKSLSDITGGDEVSPGKVNLSPAIIEHLIEGTFGSAAGSFNQVYKTVAWGADYLYALFNGKPLENVEDFQMRNVPIASKFFQRPEEQSAGSGISEEFYKYKKEADEIERKLSKYKKYMDDPIMAAKRVDLVNSSEYARYAILKEYESALEVSSDAKKNAAAGREYKKAAIADAMLKREIIDRLEQTKDDIGKSERNRVAFKMAQYKDIEKRMQKEETAYNKAVKDGTWTPQMQEAEIKRQQSPEYTIYGLYKSYESLMRKYKEAYGENSEEYQKAEAEYKPYYFKLMQDAEKKR